MGIARRVFARVVPSVGTRSLLLGAHCFFIHPVFVLAAWVKLYGWPRHPAYYVAFFLHDLGYLHAPNMDGPEGERHVERAARFMARHFGPPWGEFCLYHSRFRAKLDHKPVSRLCYADKLSTALTPAWLYLPMARLTGEIDEYMELAKQRTAAGEPKYASMKFSTTDQERWYYDVQSYLAKWVSTHSDGREDTWTPDMANRSAKTDSGVWK